MTKHPYALHCCILPFFMFGFKVELETLFFTEVALWAWTHYPAFLNCFCKRKKEAMLKGRYIFQQQITFWFLHHKHKSTAAQKSVIHPMKTRKKNLLHVEWLQVEKSLHTFFSVLWQRLHICSFYSPTHIQTHECTLTQTLFFFSCPSVVSHDLWLWFRAEKQMWANLQVSLLLQAV